ncbi:MAG: glutamate-1-semialdehyde 2,1-aminomutase, partial [Desulfobacterales bacterium]
MNRDKSHMLFQRAANVIPGGVNSPVRACKSVGAEPLFIDRADGCRLYDADGNGFIDYIGSWGPMILGHRHSSVIRSVAETLNRGMSFGAPTDLEVVIAEMIIDAVPSVEMVRMVNSGTEATMAAIRLARGATGRDLIIKFEGCYHGHGDSLLVEAGSGVATLAIPGSPGVPAAFAGLTLSLPYNDTDGFVQVMAEKGDQVAGVIVEPVAGNMGLVQPVAGFLEALREETSRHGSILIFDEVMTGFRVARGGAQEVFKIDPDLTTLGKIIGGGMPVGAYGGKKALMEQVAPAGSIYQAGTLSGNPVAMAAGIATLMELAKPNFYTDLESKAARLAFGLQEAAEKAGVPVAMERAGSMLGMFFSESPVTNFKEAKACDLDRFAAYYRGMLDNGIYLAPSQFEALFVSAAHDEPALDQTIAAAE